MLRSVGIIGYGDFGRFLHMLLSEQPQLTVRITSRTDHGIHSSPLEETCQCDAVFLTVPIRAYEELIMRIAPLLSKTSIVCDVATVKVHTTSLLRTHRIPRFVATHPMFGPFSYEKHGRSLKDLRIALCDHTLSHDEYAALQAFLSSLGLKVLEMTPEKHDRLIAETLFLTHLVGQTIKRGAFERTSIDTVSFGFLMDAVESVAHDEALFRDVFRFNPYCAEVLQRFTDAERAVVASLVS